MHIENFAFHNSRGIRLAARLYYRNRACPGGVIFSHGLFSSKDGYKITSMARDIVDAGYNLMTFDFTYSGESPGSIENISVLHEIDDLKCAIRTFREMGHKRIHLMGSSMGGVVTICASSENDFTPDSLILIATPLEFTGLIPSEDDTLHLSIDDTVSVSGVSVKMSFIDELRNLNPAAALIKIKSPVLLIHGRLDSIVNVSNFERIRSLLKTEYEALLIEDGDHNLTEAKHLNLIKEKVKNWLGKYHF